MATQIAKGKDVEIKVKKNQFQTFYSIFARKDEC